MLDTVLKSGGFAIVKDCERFFLSAFCGVGGAKWGEGHEHAANSMIDESL